MIRCIAVIDSKRGMANEHGIPWQGRLPSETAYYRRKIAGQTLLMGAKTYEEQARPVSNAQNFVLTYPGYKLRPGFIKVINLDSFFEKHNDAWIIGGAFVFAETLERADELYISRVKGDFNCTKFFPPFEDKFICIETSPVQVENGLEFHFELWRKKTL